MRTFRSMKYVGMLSMAGLVAACGDSTGPDPQPTATLSVVSGAGQSAVTGTALPTPLTVRASQGSAGMAGVAISWAVTAGGGSVNPTTSTTDGNGSASTTWTLGPNAGANTVEASSTSVTGAPLSFTATGTVLVPPPSQAAVSVQDNSFSPATRTVAVGGDVTWTWSGSNTHNVTFSAGPNSVSQAAGTFVRNFPTAGSFGYLCTIHGASMSGTITVS